MSYMNGIGGEISSNRSMDDKTAYKFIKRINGQKTWTCQSCLKRKDIMDCYIWMDEEGTVEPYISCGVCTLDGMFANLFIIGGAEFEELLVEKMKEGKNG